MSSLPILALEQEIAGALRHGNRLVLRAPTGSGKSTQVPQILDRAGLLAKGQVIVLQPRRLATRMLASRVAQEMKVPLGRDVGYQIRLDDKSGRDTRIKFVTEGVLLRMMLGDSELQGISTLVFDEFHERHLHGDIALARALEIQKTTRPDLRLVVMSATLGVEALREYLSPCQVIESEGRTYPVGIEYSKRSWIRDETPVWAAAADALEKAVLDGHQGDALVFMPGAFEIQRTISEIGARRGLKGWLVLGLHGEMGPDQQDAAIARYDQPKVIVSTNVAETSLTIDGIRLVIDGGLARMARFDLRRGINTLMVEPISRASADQRAGRAGRTAPGHAIRLWTEQEQAHRAPFDLPEIHRVDLSEAVLTLKGSGIENLDTFAWFEAPQTEALQRAGVLLADLGATDGVHGPVTAMGRRMLKFPMHPRYARLLLEAADRNCVEQAALVGALMQERSILPDSREKSVNQAREDLLEGDGTSDLFALMRAWKFAEENRFDVNACRRLGIHAAGARQVARVLDQFLGIARRERLPMENGEASGEALRRCVLAAFSDQLAKRADQGTLRCRLVHKRTGELARSSVVRSSPLLVANEIREVEQRGGDLQVILSAATAVEESWLKEMYPHDFSEADEVFYDSTARRVLRKVQRMFRDLPLEEKTSENNVPKDAAAALLAKEVLAGRLILSGWNDEVDQFILRINGLAAWWPELEIPPLNEETKVTLIEELCHGCTTYKEIKDKPVQPILATWLSSSQRDLVERYAPSRQKLPGGKSAKITYRVNDAPVVAAKIQELYGLEGGLSVADGRRPLTIEILGPNYRPVQVTQDLTNFWKETYPKLKIELKRRYPKHEWR